MLGHTILIAAWSDSGYSDAIPSSGILVTEITETATGVARAHRFFQKPDPEGFPTAAAWDGAAPLRFDWDWQGMHSDSQRATEVRLLWTPETFFLKFHARFRNITVFADADPTGRRNGLWDRDVAEVFLQPNPATPDQYKEFEIGPNGMWIDLDIAPGAKSDLHSGLRRRVVMHHAKMSWVAELAIPMAALVPRFNPADVWRLNFFRVEGPTEPRFYSAWRPTNTPYPNFHVPAVFGKLIFDTRQ